MCCCSCAWGLACYFYFTGIPKGLIYSNGPGCSKCLYRFVSSLPYQCWQVACLILGLLTPLASAAIFVSMAFAACLEIVQDLPFVARDPYLIPDGQYKGPKGKGEPPSWEKAFMYCLMLITIAVFSPGAFSLDALLFE